MIRSGKARKEHKRLNNELKRVTRGGPMEVVEAAVHLATERAAAAGRA